MSYRGRKYLEHQRALKKRSMMRENPDSEIAALDDVIRSGERNFMCGIFYRINPVDTLKMISASSVFGEPQYYRDGDNTKAAVLDGNYGIDGLFARYSLSIPRIMRLLAHAYAACILM